MLFTLFYNIKIRQLTRLHIRLLMRFVEVLVFLSQFRSNFLC